jgi:hypothetical protein
MYGKRADSAETLPAVNPPEEDTNSQWSALEMTLTRKGGMRSTLRIT